MPEAVATPPSAATGLAGPSARTVTTLTTLEGLEGIRDAWAAASLTRFDADPDFYLAFARSRSSFVRPHVVIVERDGLLESMLIARVEDVERSAKLGYRSLFRNRLRAIALVHGGLVCTTEHDARLLIRELRESLARGEADIVTLPALGVGSVLHRAAEDVPAVLRQPLLRRTVHHRLELPATMEDFLASRSKSTRQSVKRYGRKLERELGDRLDLRVYRDPADLDRILADTEPVASLTYQRGLGVALADTSEQRALLEVGLRNGWFRTYVLYLEGRPIAFWPGYGYRGTFFIGTPGYDPAFADYRVGMHLQMRMIEDLCADPALQAVDYGFGDAEYKRRFGSETTDEQDVTIFAARPRPLTINLLHATIALATTAAGGVLARTGLLDRFKRGWRRRLAPPHLRAS